MLLDKKSFTSLLTHQHHHTIWLFPWTQKLAKTLSNPPNPNPPQVKADPSSGGSKLHLSIFSLLLLWCVYVQTASRPRPTVYVRGLIHVGPQFKVWQRLNMDKERGSYHSKERKSNPIVWWFSLMFDHTCTISAPLWPQHIISESRSWWSLMVN